MIWSPLNTEQCMQSFEYIVKIHKLWYINEGVHTDARYSIINLKSSNDIHLVWSITYHIIDPDFSNIQKIFSFNCNLASSTKRYNGFITMPYTSPYKHHGIVGNCFRFDQFYSFFHLNKMVWQRGIFSFSFNKLVVCFNSLKTCNLWNVIRSIKKRQVGKTICKC